MKAKRKVTKNTCHFISLIISALLGYKVISSVPLLHTPLMSGMNALSGIIVIGAIYVYAASPMGRGVDRAGGNHGHG